MRYKLFALLSICPMSQIFGSIDGPSSEDTPIRLTREKPTMIAPAHRRELHDPPGNSNIPSSSIPNTGQQSNILSPQQQQPPSQYTKIEVVEPPNGSYIAGKHFIVKLKIHVHPDAEVLFKKKYEHDGHACLSLDDGPFHCWDIENGVVLFAGATDGQHTLVAKLYSDGVLQEDTIGEKIEFTMVHNPKFEDGINYHAQKAHTDQYNDNKNDNQKEGNVEVKYPVVELLNPLDRVSYSGHNIQVRINLEPTDPNIFQKHFRNGFVCFNLDFATAHACYSLFNYSRAAMIMGLNIGMHTIDASLIHPETGDLLHDSSAGRKTFFTAGEDNSGAAFVADINIHNRVHKVPLMHGGSIEAQATYLCSSSNSSGSINDCVEPIKMHLANIARQHRVLID